MPVAGQFEGTIELHLPSNVPGGTEYVLSKNNDVFIEPISVTGTDRLLEEEITLRISGGDPNVVFEPTADHEELPKYQFEFPSLHGSQLCEQLLSEGVNSGLLENVQAGYEPSGMRALFEFTSDATSYLTFGQFLSLLRDLSDYHEGIDQELGSRDHRLNLFKNLLLQRGAGEQYPVRTVNEFETRLETFRQVGLDEQWGDITAGQVIERVIEAVDTPGKHLGHLPVDSGLFVEYAADIRRGHFVHLLAEAMLKSAPSSDGMDPVTWSVNSDHQIDIDPEDLVKTRNSIEDIESTPTTLRDRAYEEKNMNLFEQALTSAARQTERKLQQAAADLLYWYTELSGSLPSTVQPKVYAVATGLYAETGNEFMKAAARYRNHISQGRVSRDRNDDHRNAALAFTRANSIADEYSDRPPFDPVGSFIRLVETHIERYKETGRFQEALDQAETGLNQLICGKYAEQDTNTEETQLKAWIDDLEAQHRRQDGQFNDAIDATEEAIAKFKQVGAEGNAQVAIARRHQLQAINKQLDLEFKQAASLHQKAASEIDQIDYNAAQVHRSQARACQIKHHILHGSSTEAATMLSDQSVETDPSIDNLDNLLDVYLDYENGDTTPTNTIVQKLQSIDEKSHDDRHISYDGDYRAAMLTVGAAQRLEGAQIPSEHIEKIVTGTLKQALSGGGIDSIWRESAELSAADVGRAWRRRIPARVLQMIEEVERTARSPRDYATPAMRLMAAVEAYLRLLAEHYARLEAGEDWKELVVTDGKNISLGNLEIFFERKDTAAKIEGSNVIQDQLSPVRKLRNELDHGEGISVDKSEFNTLQKNSYEIIKRTCLDAPIVATVTDADVRLDHYSLELSWTRTPRQLEITTEQRLSENKSYQISPDTDVQSGFTEIVAGDITRCTTRPSSQANFEAESTL
jgi:hypothetical protein